MTPPAILKPDYERYEGVRPIHVYLLSRVLVGGAWSPRGRRRSRDRDVLLGDQDRTLLQCGVNMAFKTTVACLASNEAMDKKVRVPVANLA